MKTHTRQEVVTTLSTNVQNMYEHGNITRKLLDKVLPIFFNAMWPYYDTSDRSVLPTDVSHTEDQELQGDNEEDVPLPTGDLDLYTAEAADDEIPLPLPIRDDEVPLALPIGYDENLVAFQEMSIAKPDRSSRSRRNVLRQQLQKTTNQLKRLEKAIAPTLKHQERIHKTKMRLERLEREMQDIRNKVIVSTCVIMGFYHLTNLLLK